MLSLKIRQYLWTNTTYIHTHTHGMKCFSLNKSCTHTLNRDLIFIGILLFFVKNKLKQFHWYFYQLNVSWNVAFLNAPKIIEFVFGENKTPLCLRVYTCLFCFVYQFDTCIQIFFYCWTIPTSFLNRKVTDNVVFWKWEKSQDKWKLRKNLVLFKCKHFFVTNQKFM